MSSRQERRAAARGAPAPRDMTDTAVAQVRAFLSSSKPKDEAALRYALAGAAAMDFGGEGVRTLLAVGAPPNGYDGPVTPLSTAASKGNAVAVQLLLAAGADPHAPTANERQCPLFVALSRARDRDSQTHPKVRLAGRAASCVARRAGRLRGGGGGCTRHC